MVTGITRRRSGFFAVVFALGVRLCLADPAATTQPEATLTPVPPSLDVGGLPSAMRVIIDKTISIPVPQGYGPAEIKFGTETDAGVTTKDQSIFYGIQVYKASESILAGNEKDLEPLAIAQVRARMTDLPADAPINVLPNPSVLLQLNYGVKMCHGQITMIDRFAKVDNVLVRVTAVPISQSLTADQVAAMSDQTEAVAEKLIESAKPYNEKAEKAATAAAQRALQGSLGGSRQIAAPRQTTGLSGSGHQNTLGAAGNSKVDPSIHRAELALAQADQYKAQGKDADAYERYKFVVKEYGKTPSAKAAADAVAAYEADAHFMASYKGGATTRPTASDVSKSAASAASKAKSLLALADSYAAAGKSDLAQEKYQAVIDQFPNSPEATIAKRRLQGN